MSTTYCVAIMVAQMREGAIAYEANSMTLSEHDTKHGAWTAADRLVREQKAGLLEALEELTATYVGVVAEVHSPIGKARAAIDKAKREGT